MREGLWRAMPVVVAYLPLAFAYGAAARASGLSFLATTLMSLIVYAGSAQMIAVTLFAAALPTASIVLTTFLINLRGLVLAMALAPKARDWSRLSRFFFGTEVTDETFALHSAPETGERLAPVPAFTVNAACHLAWITGTIAGHLVGAMLPDTRVLGLDYALVAMFVGLLMPRVLSPMGALVATVGGIVALLCHGAGLSSWSALIATVFAATVGAYLESAWQKR